MIIDNKLKRNTWGTFEIKKKITRQNHQDICINKIKLTQITNFTKKSQAPPRPTKKSHIPSR